MVMPEARCTAITEGGERCRARPLHGGAFCFWHSSETTQDATEARRLGGLRRRREGTLAGAYEFEGLATTSDLRRVLEIAALDALGLENSVARVRSLTAIVQVGARLLEVGELESRLEALETAVRPRLDTGARRR